MSDSVFTLERGTAPLLLSLPHVGTTIPDDLAPAFVPRALALEDTDWHLAEVYGFARELGASVLVPRVSRYVIDLNRPPENTPMYAGANNTELVPTRFFTGDALYRDGRVPDEREIERRRETYWRPYHDALAAELARLSRRARPRDPLGRPQHPGRAAVAVRRAPARPQPRHRRRRELRAGAARRAERRARRRNRRSATSPTAASRAATSRATTAGRASACTRSSSRWASRPTWTRRTPPFPSRRPIAAASRACSRSCATCCRRRSTGAPMPPDATPALLWAPLAWLPERLARARPPARRRRRPLGRGDGRCRDGARGRARPRRAAPARRRRCPQPRVPARLRRRRRAARRGERRLLVVARAHVRGRAADRARAAARGRGAALRRAAARRLHPRVRVPLPAPRPRRQRLRRSARDVVGARRRRRRRRHRPDDPARAVRARRLRRRRPARRPAALSLVGGRDGRGRAAHRRRRPAARRCGPGDPLAARARAPSRSRR